MADDHQRHWLHAGSVMDLPDEITLRPHALPCGEHETPHCNLQRNGEPEEEREVGIGGAAAFTRAAAGALRRSSCWRCCRSLAKEAAATSRAFPIKNAGQSITSAHFTSTSARIPALSPFSYIDPILCLKNRFTSPALNDLMAPSPAAAALYSNHAALHLRSFEPRHASCAVDKRALVNRIDHVDNYVSLPLLNSNAASYSHNCSSVYSAVHDADHVHPDAGFDSSGLFHYPIITEASISRQLRPGPSLYSLVSTSATNSLPHPLFPNQHINASKSISTPAGETAECKSSSVGHPCANLAAIDFSLLLPQVETTSGSLVSNRGFVTQLPHEVERTSSSVSIQLCQGSDGGDQDGNTNIQNYSFVSFAGSSPSSSSLVDVNPVLHPCNPHNIKTEAAPAQKIYNKMEAKLQRNKVSAHPQGVAARRRRHRISNKFKILQTLVPGGTKMDTASMLDEATEYIKYLRHQIWLHQLFQISQAISTEKGELPPTTRMSLPALPAGSPTVDFHAAKDYPDLPVFGSKSSFGRAFNLL